MTPVQSFAHFPFNEVLAALPAPPHEPYAVHWRDGTRELGLYAPVGRDDQQPHTRDELYVVVRGRGSFVSGAQRVTFGPGDALFVAAGEVHRFEDFSADLAVWVVFF